jgi:hypothetical protein
MNLETFPCSFLPFRHTQDFGEIMFPVMAEIVECIPPMGSTVKVASFVKD